ncbi:MAG TPA: DUF2911 domain-containing protein [Candidatus Acidoferrales bacterium]|nr:DUF2911 domain-containing protein [Candidatus Acidoferrales bacterium]
MAPKIARGMYGVILVLIVLARSAPSQMGGQAASPPAKTECKFPDGRSIHIEYSSPRTRGRKIFGGLVPYGEVWRAGANEATTFILDTDVNLGTRTVPRGSYTLFALPNPDAWTLIISKQTGEWGVPYPGEQDDFTRVPMKVSKLPSPLENFTIAFDQAGNSCTLRLEWETTRAAVDISEKK